MLLRQLFDTESSTYTYLLADPASGKAILIDSVVERLERDLQLLRELELELAYAVDTHVHADHVTASGVLRERTGCRVVLSERAGAVCPDVLVKQGDLLQLGDIQLEVRETPGHTSGCVSYVLNGDKAVFTGDALLVRGCGRTDFQQGDARMLYRSVHSQLFTLPDTTALLPAHDYQGRTASTIGEEKRWNPRLGGQRSEEDFAKLMADLHLPRPKQMDVAVPANVRCGLARVADVELLVRWAPVRMSACGVPEVSPEWLAARNEAVRIVDVREPDEFTGPLGHIDGAELAPLAKVAQIAKQWPRESPIVTVCRSGGRSGKAALTLQELGFSRIASMAGGMIAWRDLGMHLDSVSARVDPQGA